MIDHFVMTFLMVLWVFLPHSPNCTYENKVSKMTTTTLAVMLPGFLLYFAKDSIKGISVGKWIIVRDVNNPNEVPSFGILPIRSLFIKIWPIEFIVLASSQEKKRLSDKTAKTTKDFIFSFSWSWDCLFNIHLFICWYYYEKFRCI